MTIKVNIYMKEIGLSPISDNVTELHKKPGKITCLQSGNQIPKMSHCNIDKNMKCTTSWTTGMKLLTNYESTTSESDISHSMSTLSILDGSKDGIQNKAIPQSFLSPVPNNSVLSPSGTMEIIEHGPNILKTPIMKNTIESEDSDWKPQESFTGVSFSTEEGNKLQIIGTVELVTNNNEITETNKDELNIPKSNETEDDEIKMVFSTPTNQRVLMSDNPPKVV